MATHRLVILIFLAGTLYGLVRIFLRYPASSEMVLLIPIFMLGITTGAFLGYGCARWIKRNHVEGLVYLTKTSLVMFFVYFNILYIVPMAIYWLNPIGFCSAFEVTDRVHCVITFLRFWLFMQISLLGFLLVWGILYERRIGHRLVYKVATSRAT